MRALAGIACIVLLATACTSTPSTVAVDGESTATIETVELQSPNNPLVALRLVFKVGSVDDPSGREGLAALCAAMLEGGGTKKNTYSEILNRLYPMAADISVHTDKEVTTFYGTVHRDNLNGFAQILSEQILSPAFSPEDFKRLKQESIDFVENTLRGSDDETLGKEALSSVMYAHHPYGYPTVGRVGTLKEITLDDIKRFYKNHYAQSNLIIGLAGDYTDDFATSFARRFHALPEKRLARTAIPTPQPHEGMQALVVNKQARATAISIGHPLTITRADDDFYPLLVASSYLGEHRTFNGVLMQNMRGARGLNYGDYAYIENFIQDGWSTFPIPNTPRQRQHFEIWIRPVKPANALFSLRQAIYETAKLIDNGIPAQGFDDTRSFLMNYAKLWTQDASRRLGYAIDTRIYGRDLIAELKKRLPTMTVEDVNRAIRKHLNVNHFSVALVGPDGESLKQTLLSGQPTGITYDTKGTPDAILAEDKLIERYNLPSKAEITHIIPVEKIFD